ncbi:MAG: hypothetical protein OXI49_06695 [Acidobacteriota bacterium]|nr:hypothetical protein [Acidobacteriota bacterium]
MKRKDIVEAFRHRPPGREAIELQQRIAETMTEAVVDIAARLPEGRDRSTFIDLCRQARGVAWAAAARIGPERSAATPADERRAVEPPTGPEVPEAEPGVVRLGLAGAFHSATSASPSLETRLEVPPGLYRRAVFRFSVYHGGWNAVPSRNHNLFWFARDGHRDLFGFGIAKGPGGPPQVFYRTDWGIRHTQKQRVVERYLMQAGETYGVRFDFDAGAGRILLTIADSDGNELVRSAARPNIAEIPFGTGQQMAVGFGFRGKYDNEPAQPGWIWSDLAIRLEPVGG